MSALATVENVALALQFVRGDALVPAVSTSAIARLPERSRAAVLEKHGILMEFLTAQAASGPAGRTREFADLWCRTRSLVSGRPLACTTLYKWLAAWRKNGLAGLVDARTGNGRGVCWDDAAMAAIVQLYVAAHGDGENRLSAALCHDRMLPVCAAKGWRMPSVRVAQAYIHKRVDPKLKAAGRDPREFERMLPGVVRDWAQLAAGECWFADHMRFDVLIPMLRRDRTWGWYRPWLTMWLDARTWKPMGWLIRFDTPNGQAVMSAFIAGVREYGTPRVAYIDNGKDFRCERFSGGRARRVKPGERISDESAVGPLLSALGVQAQFALPYHPQSKCIEPFFKLVHMWFDKLWETYCGSEAKDRPGRWGRAGQTERLDGRAEEFATQKGFTLERFADAFNRWIMNDYLGRECPSESCKPYTVAEAFTRYRYPTSRPADADLSLLLTPSKAARVQGNGIWVAAHRGWYHATELLARVGASGRDIGRHIVYRWLEHDPSYIYVFDAITGRFLCLARPYAGDKIHPLAEPGSGDAKRLSGVMAERGRQRKAAREALRIFHAQTHELLLSVVKRNAEVAALDREALPAAKRLPAVNAAAWAAAQ